MQRYEKYKDSKIGEIPEHWDFKRFRYCLNLNKGLTITKANLQDDGIPCVNYGEIHSKFGFEIIPEEDHLKCVDEDYLDSSEQSLLNRGDFVFADTSEDIKGSGNFTHLHSDTKIFAGYHTIIARLKIDADYRYIAYYFDSLSHRHQIRKQVKGVKVYSITNLILKDTFIFLPPKFEQQKIATYLTQKTKEIDTLITQKKQLLSLYEEEKKAIINQAVTKGVDTNVPMKESGIAWIGDIPKNWEIKRLKYILTETLKYGANESALYSNIEDPRYIRITDFGADGKLKKSTFKSLPFEKAKDYMLSNEDILFARSGATVGKTFQFKNYNGQACFAGYLIKASVNSKIILSDFLYFYTKSDIYERWKNSIFNQATIQNIGADKYANLWIPLPKVSEQVIILEKLEYEIKKIDTKIKKTKDIITLQKEYRTALISEVVTGKIKVTEEV